MSASAKHAVDLVAFLCAGVAAVSLAQTAVFVSIVAGVLSAVLAGMRIYDRLTYGPLKRGD
jgi:uncharacterized membrane protein YeiH